VIDLKPGFTRFFAAYPDRLHFAAHSHHPWPDVSYDAHLQAWLDAAALADDKWEHFFEVTLPRTQALVGDVIGLADPTSLTFGPNTHGFVNRIFSCLEPPVRVLTTDAEFHSFHRQSRRWEEAGVAIVDRVPAEPHDTFEERFTREAAAGVHDLVYLSQVLFDSGLVVEGIDRIVSSVPNNQTFIVVDGYHAFMARPVNIGAIQDRVFYLAGGYKYAMAGEGACFLHSPSGYGPRPLDTGWYAGFGQLESGVTELVPFATDGSRFAGATYDVSGVYRLRSVLEWLTDEGVAVADIHDHAAQLGERFLGAADSLGAPVVDAGKRGNFLTFRTDRAAEIYGQLHDRKVITDHRGDRLRIGFGVYHDEADVDRLAAALAGLPLAE
jgi:selenocysteine lyase/cysteine desulfurase